MAMALRGSLYGRGPLELAAVGPSMVRVQPRDAAVV